MPITAGLTDVKVTAQVTDQAGNLSPEAQDMAGLDTTAPSAPTVTIVDDSNNDQLLSKEEIGNDQVQVKVEVNHAELTAGGKVTLTIINNGSERTVELTLNPDGTLQADDGRSYSYNNGVISWTEQTPADGQLLTVNATQTDKAGNVSLPGSDTAAVDTTAPSAPTVTIVDDGDNNGILSKAEIGADQILVKALVDHADLLAGGKVTLTIYNDSLIPHIVDVTLKADGTLQSSDGKSYSYDGNGEISWTEIAPADSKSLTVEATQTDLAGNTSDQATDSAKVVIADKPILSVNNYVSMAAVDFDGVQVKPGWYVQTTTDALLGDSVIGKWHANHNGKIEVGKESVYIPGGDKDNQVLEIEGDRGVTQLFTILNCEAGRFYELGFDVSARSNYPAVALSSCGLTISLIKLDAVGNEITDSKQVIYDFTPTKVGWLKDQMVGIDINESGKYKLVFESKDTSVNANGSIGDGMGAVLDNINFQAVDNKGYADGYIKLGQINAALTDNDGSETLAVFISGLPVGAELTDGKNSWTFSAGEKLDITDWDLSDLQFKSDIVGDHKLTIEAVATEGETKESESDSTDFTVTVLPTTSTISLATDDSELSPMMAAISEDDILQSVTAADSKSAEEASSPLSRGGVGLSALLDSTPEINLSGLSPQAHLSSSDEQAPAAHINQGKTLPLNISDLLDNNGCEGQDDISQLLSIFDQREGDGLLTNTRGNDSVTQTIGYTPDSFDNLSGGMGGIANQTLDLLLNAYLLDIDK
ncbi:MAG: hypothetical protein ACRDCX_13220 [Aeromonas sp.]